MEYNTLANLTACKDTFDQVSGIVYYSHLPPLLVSVFFCVYLLFSKRDRNSMLLGTFVGLYTFYVLFDLLQWMYPVLVFTSIGGIVNSLTVVTWSGLGTIVGLMFFVLHIFVHEFGTKEKLPLPMLCLWTVLLAPVLVFAPTVWNIAGFDSVTCAAQEGQYYTNYYYALGVVAIVAIWYSTILGLRKNIEKRGAIITVSLGAELFTLTFLGSGALASYLVSAGITPDFGFDQLGLLMMAFFIGMLVFAIVRYEAFNMRLLAAQAITISMLGGISSLLFFVNNVTGIAVIGITLCIGAIGGYFLVRSVKAVDVANQGQIRLLHFISHEVKGFLGKGRNALAAVAEGDFGKVPKEAEEIAKLGEKELGQGVEMVENLLSAASFEKGTMQFSHEPFDVVTVVREVGEKLRPDIEKKGLVLTVDLPHDPLNILGDEQKMRQNVTRNLVENSLNYTQKGSIALSLKQKENNAVLTIKDTGVGITREDMQKLFTAGGHGAESQKINVHSTGYGLFNVKQVVEAHGGTVTAFSEGKDTGSMFTVILPLIKDKTF